jgi:MinD-like ATPase involved in chromosome partitioning or flagellar assembly
MSISEGSSVKRPPGRIVTFYSYKGGTGRSMALANIAWILATNGQRVLVIDWDLEAPGLHRWFRPFLDDPELQETRGLIDFFEEFAEGSRIEARRRAAGEAVPDDNWFQQYSNLARFAIGIDFEFPNEGLLHLVPAGRQDAEYPLQVQGFNWQDFYKTLGGGLFLEDMKRRLRGEYDYILVDSRTGISDTAGICTVQLPDDLVACFTMNRQSILGARGICRSAEQQRLKPDGQPGLRIWPVPTRVELSEKERLDAARDLMRREFSGLPWHLTRKERADYWKQIEVLYVPYYACEETLATLADNPGLTNTLLHAMETVTGWLTDKRFVQAGALEETRRQEALKRYSSGDFSDRASEKDQALNLVVVHTRADWPPDTMGVIVNEIELAFPNVNVFWGGRIPVGKKWADQWTTALNACDVAVVFWSKSISENCSTEPWPIREYCERLAFHASAVVPINNEGIRLPDFLNQWHGIELGELLKDEDSWEFGTYGPGLCKLLEPILADCSAARLTTAAHVSDEDDPHKGQFGGLSQRNGATLSAHVEALRSDWFEIHLTVKVDPAPSEPMTVRFHLHPTFRISVREVPLQSGRAELVLRAWGAFTVGVEVNGRTRLELDLAELSDAPREFRER